ncbi:RidA family protein [Achromobacter aloeverae]
MNTELVDWDSYDNRKARRIAIYVDGVNHKNPIPACCRRGSLVESGSIFGRDPTTGELAEGIEAQCRHMLENLRLIVEAAGGSPEDIVKVTVWMKDRGHRPVLNVPWLALFPDAGSRPARHAIHAPHLDGGKLLECVFTAYIPETQVRT